MVCYQADTVVIGAGVIGLAVARALALRGRQVWVLEAQNRIGTVTSSRNSEVIHAGIYYPAGSLKAGFCVDGRERLYHYCRERQIPHRQTGKWLVATDQTQIPALEAIERQAAQQGVSLMPVATQQLTQEMPFLKAVAALASPTTGIIDSHALMQALLADLQACDGQLILRSPVLSVASDADGHRLQLGGDQPCELRTRQLVNAAGLQAVPLLQRWAGYPAAAIPAVGYAKGHYFAWQGRHPFNRLIYPLPEAAGLGVHLTLDLQGQARFGPDVAWVDNPDDYTVPAALAEDFARQIRRWWPQVDVARLQPAYAGIRPKLHGPQQGPADFRIDGPDVHHLPGLVCLLGIESPGLTSCLALAEYVADCF